jgi:hypothetical protein
MKKFADKKIIFAAAFVFLAAILFLPGAASAATPHDVTISGPLDVYAHAYGNSDDGTTPINADLDGNTLNIDSGGHVFNNAIGAYGEFNNGDSVWYVTGNTINVNSGGTVDKDATGGYAFGYYNNATASNNTANIFGAVSVGVVGGYAYVNSSYTATANNNTVVIDGGLVGGGVYGGSANGNFGSGAASRNEVIIKNNAAVNDFVYGGRAQGDTGATADDNTVTIDGGTITGDVMGGYVSGNGNNFAPVQADNNTVNISGGTLNGNVYGGFVEDGAGSAKGNTITISGSPAFNSVSIISGGGLGSGGSDDVFTGNTLNLRTPITVGNVQNFEFYNFYLPAAFTAGDTMLIVSGTGYGAHLSDGGSGRSTVNVGIAGSAAPLKKGDRVTLIDASASDTGIDTSPANTVSSGTQGVTMKYKFALLNDSYKLYADVTEASLSEESKALSEGRAANLAAVTAGGDLIADAGMKSGFAASRELNAYTFGAISYNSSRYDTGSHADGGTFSVLAGLARNRAVKYGAFTYGGFIEAGWGNYDAYNSFTNASDVRGSGDANYYGAGLSFRMDYGGDEKGHFYNDAAVRFGKSSNDYESGDLRDANGNAATYETDSGYYGAHLTLGYMKNLSDGANLNLYTRILWTHLNGDDTTLSTGDPVSFDGADSWRWRTGLRYYASPKNGARFYAGAAYEYEYEFGGGVDATAYGLPIDAPSLEGGTAIG